MTRYKEGKVAMRWRVEKEVVTGKGHFVCGSKSCQEGRGLRSYEVNFAYVEDKERKNALVKLRLCPECGFKLHYKKYKALPRSEYKEVKRQAEEAMKNGGYPEDLRQQKAARDKAYGERDRKKSRDAYIQGITKRARDAAMNVGGRGDDVHRRDGEREERSSKRPKGVMGGVDKGTRQEEEEAAKAEETAVGPGSGTVWTEKPKAEITKEDEFKEYFAGMFP